MNKGTILDLCSGTGAWSKPYSEDGYNIIEYDTLFDNDKRTYDVRLMEKEIIGIEGRIIGILAAPPCTHLSSSGARWWKQKGIKALLEALSIVDACLRAVIIHEPDWWCLENPVGRLSRYLGKPKYTFHPNDYAKYSDDPISNEYSKLTCLWGKFNIPKRKPGKMRKKEYVHYLPPSKDRAMIRGITPDGFAKAFFLFNR